MRVKRNKFKQRLEKEPRLKKEKRVLTESNTTMCKQSEDPKTQQFSVASSSTLESDSLRPSDKCGDIQGKSNSAVGCEVQRKEEREANPNSCGISDNADSDSLVDITGLDTESESDYILSQLQGHHDEWKFSSNDDRSSVSRNTGDMKDQSKRFSPDLIDIRENEPHNDSIHSSESEITEAADMVPYIQKSYSESHKRRPSLPWIVGDKEIQEKNDRNAATSIDWLLGQISREKKEITESSALKISSDPKKNPKKREEERKRKMRKVSDESISQKSTPQATCEGLSVKKRVGEADGGGDISLSKSEVLKPTSMIKKKKEKKKKGKDKEKKSKMVVKHKYIVNRDEDLTRKVYLEFLRSKGFDEETLEKLPNCSTEKSCKCNGCLETTIHKKKTKKGRKNTVQPDKFPEEIILDGSENKTRLYPDVDLKAGLESNSGNEEVTILSNREGTVTTWSEGKSIEKEKDRRHASKYVGENSRRETLNSSMIEVSDDKGNSVDQSNKKKKKKKKKMTAKGDREVETLADDKNKIKEKPLIEENNIQSLIQKSTDKVSKDRQKKKKRKLTQESSGSSEVDCQDSLLIASSLDNVNILEKSKSRERKKGGDDYGKSTGNPTSVVPETIQEVSLTCNSGDLFQETPEIPRTTENPNFGCVKNAIRVEDRQMQKEIEEIDVIPTGVKLSQSFEQLSSPREIANTHSSSEQSIVEASCDTELNKSHSKVNLNNFVENKTFPKSIKCNSSSSQHLSASPWHRLSRDSNGSFTQPTPTENVITISSSDEKLYSSKKGQKKVMKKTIKSCPLLDTASSEDESTRIPRKSQRICKGNLHGHTLKQSSKSHQCDTSLLGDNSDNERNEPPKIRNLHGLTQKLPSNSPQVQTKINSANTSPKKSLPKTLNLCREPVQLLSLEKELSSSSHRTSAHKNSTDVDVGIDDKGPRMIRNSSDSLIDQANTTKSLNVKNTVSGKGLTLKEIVMNRMNNSVSSSSSFDEEEKPNFVSKKRKLGNSDSGKKPRTSSKVHLCTRCNQSFDSATQMMRHECKRMFHMKKGSHPEAKFPCDQCERKYKNKFHLYHHVRTFHLGRRDYQCELCPMAFGEKQTLVVHMRMHTGAEPFACTLCKATFKTKSNLHTHFRTGHHLVPKFFCDRCDNRAYYFERDLHEHTRTIHHTIKHK